MATTTPHTNEGGDAPPPLLELELRVARSIRPASGTAGAVACGVGASGRTVALGAALGPPLRDPSVIAEITEAFVARVGLAPEPDGAARLAAGLRIANNATWRSRATRDEPRAVALAGLIVHRGMVHAINAGSIRVHAAASGSVELFVGDHCVLPDGAWSQAAAMGGRWPRDHDNVTEALGAREHVIARSVARPATIGDRYLLCTATVWADQDRATLAAFLMHPSLTQCVRAAEAAFRPGVDCGLVVAEVCKPSIGA